MLRIELYWSDSFEPKDLNNDEQVKHEIGRLLEFLDEVQHISQWLVNPTAIRPYAEFDYGEFKERVRKRLEAYGVYGDRDTSAPALQEQRIIQQWHKIIK